MIGKKKQNKTGKLYIEAIYIYIYIYIYLHYDAETCITKHLEEGRGYGYFPCVSKHQS